MAAGPVSRILSALRRDDHSSGPRITARLKRPTRRLWRTEPARCPGKPEGLPGNPSLFGLAPCGVCPARRITAAAVRSYRTFSPLPEPKPRRYVLCCAFRLTGLNPPSRTLSGTLLCGVRTFLCFATATVRSGCQQNHYSARRTLHGRHSTQTARGGWRRTETADRCCLSSNLYWE